MAESRRLRGIPRHSRAATQAELWRYTGAVGKIWRLRQGQLPASICEQHAKLLLECKKLLLPHVSDQPQAQELLTLFAALAGSTPSKEHRTTFASEQQHGVTLPAQPSDNIQASAAATQERHNKVHLASRIQSWWRRVRTSGVPKRGREAPMDSCVRTVRQSAVDGCEGSSALPCLVAAPHPQFRHYTKSSVSRWTDARAILTKGRWRTGKHSLPPYLVDVLRRCKSQCSGAEPQRAAEARAEMIHFRRVREDWLRRGLDAE